MSGGSLQGHRSIAGKCKENIENRMHVHDDESGTNVQAWRLGTYTRLMLCCPLACMHDSLHANTTACVHARQLACIHKCLHACTIASMHEAIACTHAR
eukprot:364937-Chlamydomonas_euryale.AAC.26